MRIQHLAQIIDVPRLPSRLRSPCGLGRHGYWLDEVDGASVLGLGVLDQGGLVLYRTPPGLEESRPTHGFIAGGGGRVGHDLGGSPHTFFHRLFIAETLLHISLIVLRFKHTSYITRHHFLHFPFFRPTYISPSL